MQHHTAKGPIIFTSGPPAAAFGSYAMMRRAITGIVIINELTIHHVASGSPRLRLLVAATVVANAARPLTKCNQQCD